MSQNQAKYCSRDQRRNVLRRLRQWPRYSHAAELHELAADMQERLAKARDNVGRLSGSNGPGHYAAARYRALDSAVSRRKSEAGDSPKRDVAAAPDLCKAQGPGIPHYDEMTFRKCRDDAGTRTDGSAVRTAPAPLAIRTSGGAVGFPVATTGNLGRASGPASPCSPCRA